jgi:iron complex transport system substrate-binding protein
MARTWGLKLLGLVGMGVLALALAACGSDDDNGGPSAATATAEAKTDLSRDDLGRSVTVNTPARRVVAMSPSMVELMFAVGATPVGRPSSADYPAAAASVPDFGTSYDFSDEVIANMRPDLILADAILQQGQIDRLARLGAPVFAVKVASFEDVLRGLRVVGALTGNEAAGEREAKALEDKLASVKSRVPTTQPNVVILIGGRGPIYVAKNDAWAGSLVTLLGGRNIVPSGPDTFQLPGFTEYSLERLAERNPDVIIVISPQTPPAPPTSQMLAASPVWGSLKAVREGRVHEVDPAVYLQSAGPRVSQVLDELPRILYPDVFQAAR